MCTIHVAKTKGLISCVVTAQLICAFFFAYAKNRFFHDGVSLKRLSRHLQVLMIKQTIGVLKEKIFNLIVIYTF